MNRRWNFASLVEAGPKELLSLIDSNSSRIKPVRRDIKQHKKLNSVEGSKVQHSQLELEILDKEVSKERYAGKVGQNLLEMNKNERRKIFTNEAEKCRKPRNTRIRGFGSILPAGSDRRKFAEKDVLPGLLKNNVKSENPVKSQPRDSKRSRFIPKSFQGKLILQKFDGSVQQEGLFDFDDERSSLHNFENSATSSIVQPNALEYLGSFSTRMTSGDAVKPSHALEQLLKYAVEPMAAIQSVPASPPPGRIHQPKFNYLDGVKFKRLRAVNYVCKVESKATAIPPSLSFQPSRAGGSPKRKSTSSDASSQPTRAGGSPTRKTTARGTATSTMNVQTANSPLSAVVTASATTNAATNAATSASASNVGKKVDEGRFRSSGLPDRLQGGQVGENCRARPPSLMEQVQRLGLQIRHSDSTILSQSLILNTGRKETIEGESREDQRGEGSAGLRYGGGGGGGGGGEKQPGVAEENSSGNLRLPLIGSSDISTAAMAGLSQDMHSSFCGCADSSQTIQYRRLVDDPIQSVASSDNTAAAAQWTPTAASVDPGSATAVTEAEGTTAAKSSLRHPLPSPAIRSVTLSASRTEGPVVMTDICSVIGEGETVDCGGTEITIVGVDCRRNLCTPVGGQPVEVEDQWQGRAQMSCDEGSSDAEVAMSGINLEAYFQLQSAVPLASNSSKVSPTNHLMTEAAAAAGSMKSVKSVGCIPINASDDPKSPLMQNSQSTQLSPLKPPSQPSQLSTHSQLNQLQHSSRHLSPLKRHSQLKPLENLKPQGQFEYPGIMAPIQPHRSPSTILAPLSPVSPTASHYTVAPQPASAQKQSEQKKLLEQQLQIGSQSSPSGSTSCGRVDELGRHRPLSRQSHQDTVPSQGKLDISNTVTAVPSLMQSSSGSNTSAPTGSATTGLALTDPAPTIPVPTRLAPPGPSKPIHEVLHAQPDDFHSVTAGDSCASPSLVAAVAAAAFPACKTCDSKPSLASHPPSRSGNNPAGSATVSDSVDVSVSVSAVSVSVSSLMSELQEERLARIELEKQLAGMAALFQQRLETYAANYDTTLLALVAELKAEKEKEKEKEEQKQQRVDTMQLSPKLSQKLPLQSLPQLPSQLPPQLPPQLPLHQLETSQSHTELVKNEASLIPVVGQCQTPPEALLQAKSPIQPQPHSKEQPLIEIQRQELEHQPKSQPQTSAQNPTVTQLQPQTISQSQSHPQLQLQSLLTLSTFNESECGEFKQSQYGNHDDLISIETFDEISPAAACPHLQVTSRTPLQPTDSPPPASPKIVVSQVFTASIAMSERFGSSRFEMSEANPGSSSPGSSSPGSSSPGSNSPSGGLQQHLLHSTSRSAEGKDIARCTDATPKSYSGHAKSFTPPPSFLSPSEEESAVVPTEEAQNANAARGSPIFLHLPAAEPASLIGAEDSMRQVEISSAALPAASTTSAAGSADMMPATLPVENIAELGGKEKIDSQDQQELIASSSLLMLMNSSPPKSMIAASIVDSNSGRTIVSPSAESDIPLFKSGFSVQPGPADSVKEFDRDRVGQFDCSPLSVVQDSIEDLFVSGKSICCSGSEDDGRGPGAHTFTHPKAEGLDKSGASHDGYEDYVFDLSDDDEADVATASDAHSKKGCDACSKKSSDDAIGIEGDDGKGDDDTAVTGLDVSGGDTGQQQNYSFDFDSDSDDPDWDKMMHLCS